MAMKRLLRVKIYGQMSQSTLERFRTSLRLRKRGRLSDEEDAEFGYRYLRDEGDDWVELSLWRIDDMHWSVRLSYMNEPVPVEVIQQVRADIVATAEKHGFTVESIWEQGGAKT
jgi:hypothetical protein